MRVLAAPDLYRAISRDIAWGSEDPLESQPAEESKCEGMVFFLAPGSLMHGRPEPIIEPLIPFDERGSRSFWFRLKMHMLCTLEGLAFSPAFPLMEIIRTGLLRRSVEDEYSEFRRALETHLDEAMSDLSQLMAVRRSDRSLLRALLKPWERPALPFIAALSSGRNSIQSRQLPVQQLAFLTRQLGGFKTLIQASSGSVEKRWLLQLRARELSVT